MNEATPDPTPGTAADLAAELLDSITAALHVVRNRAALVSGLAAVRPPGMFRTLDDVDELAKAVAALGLGQNPQARAFVGMMYDVVTVGREVRHG
jgi:hypothetical protein